MFLVLFLCIKLRFVFVRPKESVSSSETRSTESSRKMVTLQYFLELKANIFKFQLNQKS